MRQEYQVNSSSLRLDEFLPKHHFGEKHSTHINASPQQVFRAIYDCNIGKSSIIRLLIKIRKGFGWLFSNKAEQLELGNLAAFTAAAGFILLSESIGSEILFGFAGRFWQPAGTFVRGLTPAEFLRFNSPDYCKGGWNFYVSANPDGTTTLFTETRVLCLGWAKLLFPPYWLIVRPFSSWIRLELLRLIKEQAEKN